MVTKRFLKNVIVAMVSVFMSLAVVQGFKPSKRASITRVFIYCLLMAVSSSF